MKKRILIILTAMLTLFLFSCSNYGWRGLYDEDLSTYLTLTDYTALRYEMPKIDVSDDEVNERIATMLEAATETVETDEKLSNGMLVCFDRYCFIDGQAMPEYSFESETYAVGGVEYEEEKLNLLLPKLIGLKKGDTSTVEITLTDGTKVTYNVTVLAVYKKITLTLTDKNASKLIAGCNTVAELKAEVLRRLEVEKTNAAEKALFIEIRKTLVDNSTVIRTPYSLYRDYYEDRMYLYEKLANAAGLSLEEYLEKCTDMTYDELCDEIAAAASADVKEALVLYSIVKKENITCTKEEISEFAENMASDSEGIFENGEEYMSYYGENAVKDEYLWHKVVEIVLSYSKTK